MADAYTPKKQDRFTFGLWTVGNVGRDPFGDPVRRPIPPTRIVRRLRMSLELTTFTLAFLICQRVSAIIMIFMMVELNGG